MNASATIEDEGDVSALGHILFEGGVSPERAQRVARYLIEVTDPEFGEED